MGGGCSNLGGGEVQHWSNVMKKTYGIRKGKRPKEGLWGGNLGLGLGSVPKKNGRRGGVSGKGEHDESWRKEKVY